MGAGQQVTALYEIELTDRALMATVNAYSDLKYQTIVTDNTEEIATLHLRYKLPDATESAEYVYPVRCADYSAACSDNLAFASAVAEFGMVVRGSQYCGSSDCDTVLSRVQRIASVKDDAEKQEFASLVFLARERIS